MYMKSPSLRKNRFLSLLLKASVLLVVAVQFVPYGRTHTNPPVAAEPAWDSPATRALFMRSCGNCHSNETVWPWYSNIAPVSWLVQSDVDGGRAELNMSEWGRAKNKADDAAKEIRDGDMPPWIYAIGRPSSALTPTEKESLIAGLTATVAGGKKAAPAGAAPAEEKHGDDDND